MRLDGVLDASPLRLVPGNGEQGGRVHDHRVGKPKSS
jgi:hypothetical protein